MIEGKNFIGYDKSAKGSITYQTVNPKLNMDNPWKFHQATPDEINEAVEKAGRSFSIYNQKTAKERALFLRKIAANIENLGDALIETYVNESGLPQGRALGERGRTINQLMAFADLLEEGSWVKATIETGGLTGDPGAKPDLRKMNVPIGPIVVFGASNFPLAFSTAGGDTASALAAGCPVIVKSHPMHAGTSELVASAISSAAQETDMPDGVFSHLNSKGIEVGELLIKHSLIKGVGFTGSRKGGMALYKMAAEREEPIPVFAEMGSVNPVVILPKAVSEKGKEWAKTLSGSINMGAGQFCTNPGLILGIAGDDLDQFGKELSRELLSQESSCMLHPNIAEAFHTGSRKMLDEKGVEMLALEMENHGENHGRQALVKVNGTDFIENKRLHQEVFGPFSMLVCCRDLEELTAIVNNLEGQLTGTVLAQQDEAQNYKPLIQALSSRVGRIIFNNVPTGVEVCGAMQHGGPFPASTDSRFTAVGVHAINRWVRPFAYQDWPSDLLPEALQDDNPLGILREVNGKWDTGKIN